MCIISIHVYFIPVSNSLRVLITIRYLLLYYRTTQFVQSLQIMKLFSKTWSNLPRINLAANSFQKTTIPFYAFHFLFLQSLFRFPTLFHPIQLFYELLLSVKEITYTWESIQQNETMIVLFCWIILLFLRDTLTTRFGVLLRKPHCYLHHTFLITM